MIYFPTSQSPDTKSEISRMYETRNADVSHFDNSAQNVYVYRLPYYDIVIFFNLK